MSEVANYKMRKMKVSLCHGESSLVKSVLYVSVTLSKTLTYPSLNLYW